MKDLKKIRGITLISLIVTIIILLILAGISIQLIGGSNGILNRASSALDANDKATATEKMELKITYLNMVSYGENTRKATLQELADGLFADKEVEYVKLKNQEVATLEPIDVSGESSFFVKLKEYAYEFEIDENLQLASVDGVKVATNTNNDELKSKIEQMEAQMTDLEEKYKTVQTNLENTKNELNQLKNTQKTTTADVLFTGTANTGGAEYTMSDISSYKYLVVYMDLMYSGVRSGINTNVINVDNIVYNNSTTLKENTMYANHYAYNGSDAVVSYWFKNSTKFRIHSAGGMSNVSNPRIFRIEGIK